jgi:hypothetical protein
MVAPKSAYLLLDTTFLMRPLESRAAIEAVIPIFPELQKFGDLDWIQIEVGPVFVGVRRGAAPSASRHRL